MWMQLRFYHVHVLISYIWIYTINVSLGLRRIYISNQNFNICSSYLHHKHKVADRVHFILDMNLNLILASQGCSKVKNKPAIEFSSKTKLIKKIASLQMKLFVSPENDFDTFGLIHILFPRWAFSRYWKTCWSLPPALKSCRPETS